MIKLDITEKIKKEYIKTLKNIFLTPKTKKFTENSKRFYNMCKSVGFKSYSIELFIHDTPLFLCKITDLTDYLDSGGKYHQTSFYKDQI